MENQKIKNLPNEGMSKFSKVICSIVEVCFLLFSILCLSVSIHQLSSRLGKSVPIVALSIILIVLGLAVFLVFGGKLIEKIERIFRNLEKISVVKLSIFIFLFVSLSKILFVFLFDNNYTIHDDMIKYWSFANQIATNGIITEHAEYAIMYPYTVAYGLFLSPIAKLFGNDTKVLTAFLSILYAVVSILLFDILKDYISKVRAFLGVMLFNLIPFGLLATQALIHETALLFFYILSFWLLYKAMKGSYKIATKLIMIVASALLITFGSRINKGGLVVLITFLIYYGINLFRDCFSAKKVLHFVLCVVIYLLCLILISGLITSIINNSIGITQLTVQNENRKNNSVSLGWGLYLGTNIEQYGKWNYEDYQTYFKYDLIDNAEEAKAYQWDLINERLDYFKENPLRIFPHLYHKFYNLWSQPYIWIDYTENGSSQISQALFSFHQHLVVKLLIVINVMFLMLESFINLVSYKRRKESFKNNKSVLSPKYQFMMLILGLMIALIFFEVTEKYVSHMQFVLFAIVLLNLDCFIQRSNWINNKLFGKIKKKKELQKG